MKKILFIIFIGIFISCATFEKTKSLDPESKEFLSITRYIITNEERKEFLNLPPEKRKEYIEDFWKKRPTGFKEEYYRRIEYANKMFRGPKPGWLQDRGMVYIIYGAPSQVERYPMGSASYPYAHEIWYYEFIQIVFVDPYGLGDYRLTAESSFILDTIRSIPTAEVLNLNPVEKKKSLPFKFEFEIEMEENGVIINISIPYENISFLETNGVLETELETIITIEGKKELKRSKTSKISFSKEEIEKLSERFYKIKIPLELEKGKYKGNITILNKVSKEKASKKIEFLF